MSVKNPYQILRVAPTATDDEVKAAYRELAKKYHPDNYANNPLADLAQEKMQEINEAYDAIVKERKQGGASYGGAYTGGASYGGTRTGGTGGYGRSTGSSYHDIRSLIHAGRILDAEMLLDGIPASGRNAEWNFLKGSVLYRKGWLEDAYTHFVTASRMDPGNMEYRTAVSQLEQRRAGGYRTGGSECDACDCCSSLICLNCLCNGCR